MKNGLVQHIAMEEPTSVQLSSFLRTRIASFLHYKGDIISKKTETIYLLHAMRYSIRRRKSQKVLLFVNMI